MKEINPAADAQSVDLDFELVPGNVIRIHITDPDGKPLSGVNVAGRTASGWYRNAVEASFTAINFGKTSPLVYDELKAIAASKLRDERILRFNSSTTASIAHHYCQQRSFIYFKQL